MNRWWACCLSMTSGLLVLINSGAMGAEGQSTAGEHILWYRMPAQNWETEALPIGNGRLGGMVFGGVHQEHIQFNEDSLWIGDEHDTGSYQAFGDLYVDYGDTCGPSGVSNPSQHVAPPREDLEKTVDGNAGTKWCVQHAGQPVSWQLTLPQPADVPLTSYTLTSANDKPARDPQHWQLLGSDDGTEWTVLDERRLSGPFSKRHQAKTFTFENERPYRCYRFVFQPTDKTHFQVAEIVLGAPQVALRIATGLGAAESYERSLDIARAVHHVRYAAKGTNYCRTSFVSYPAQVMVLRFTADKPAAYTGRISLTDAHQGKVVAQDNRITSSGSLAGYVYADGSTRGRTEPYKMVLDYEAQLLVLHEGGSIEARDDGISFHGCDALTLLLAADTDYVNRREQGWKGEHPHARLAAQLAAAAEKSFEDLLAEHTRDYQALFDRFALDLGTTPDAIRKLPTDERLAKYKEEPADPDLEELLFQYARYLMISSSRPGSLPANLQGLWNRSNRPPWRCDYHTDVNVEMNYWFVDPANLAECFEPLAEWGHSIRGVRRDETQNTFGTRGWICPMRRTASSAARPGNGPKAMLPGWPRTCGITTRSLATRNICAPAPIRFSRSCASSGWIISRLLLTGHWSHRTASRRSTARMKTGSLSTSSWCGTCSPTTSKPDRPWALTSHSGRRSLPCAAGSWGPRSAAGASYRNGWLIATTPRTSTDTCRT